MIIVDTHALLWFLAGDDRLAQPARQAIEDRSNDVRVSDASLWEIAIKLSIGKLSLTNGVAGLSRAAFVDNGFERLEIRTDHLIDVSILPFVEYAGRTHRDPFDRLLVAQTRVEGASLVTAETWWAAAYGVEIVWERVSSPQAE